MKFFSQPCKSVLEDHTGECSSSPIYVELVVTDPLGKSTFASVFREHENFQILESFDQAVPHMTILEIDADPEVALETIQSFHSVCPARDIFLTGFPPDSAVLLEALRAGVKEFFPYPVDPQNVSKALSRYAESQTPSNLKNVPQGGRILSVLGSSGGLGVTSSAINCAVSLKAQEPEKSVVLVEVDQQSGNLPAYLDLSPSYSFQDINKNFPRLDDTLVKKFLIDHESGIQVLPSGYDNLHPGRLDAIGVKQTIVLLSSLFDYVVVDAGHTLEAPAIEALSLSDHIFLLTTLQVPVIHRTKAILQALKEECVEGRVELVANRYRDEEDGLIEETESVLQHRVSWRIPEDGIPARQAINQGAPCVLLYPKSPIAKSYTALARWVSGRALMSIGNQKTMSHFQKIIQYGRAKLHLVEAS